MAASKREGGLRRSGDRGRGKETQTPGDETTQSQMVSQPAPQRCPIIRSVEATRVFPE